MSVPYCSSRSVWLTLDYLHPVTESERWPAVCLRLVSYLSSALPTSLSARRPSIHLSAPRLSNSLIGLPLALFSCGVIIDGGVIVSSSLALELFLQVSTTLLFKSCWKWAGCSGGPCIALFSLCASTKKAGLPIDWVWLSNQSARDLFSNCSSTSKTAWTFMLGVSFVVLIKWQYFLRR